MWVVNASPLILLGRVDRLDLIERLTPDIAVPDAVITEIRAGQHKDSTAAKALEIEAHRWGLLPPFTATGPR